MDLVPNIAKSQVCNQERALAGRSLTIAVSLPRPN